MRLTDREQRHVRTALRFLRLRVGGWQPLADALGVKADTIGKVLRGGRSVTASLAPSHRRGRTESLIHGPGDFAKHLGVGLAEVVRFLHHGEVPMVPETAESRWVSDVNGG